MNRFGAVLEEFELRDALEGVLAEKSMQTLDNMFISEQQVPVMA
jgi:hypothetical protein